MAKPQTCRRIALIGAALLCLVAANAAPAQVFTTLVNFAPTNGSNPYYGPLIQGTDGNFYGTTSNGGANGNGGTVFQLMPGGTLNTLYSFCSLASCADGANPYGSLIQDTADGNFYGTTYAGGLSNCTSGCGTLFRITPQGALTTIYNFCSQANCVDGAGPASGLIQDSAGNLYGTTYAGGGGNCGNGCGTVFKISLQGVLTPLANFSHSAGAHPNAGVVQANGNFYGTTYYGGANNDGAIFEVTSAGALITLYSFCSQPNCTDGLYPSAGLIQGSDGSFYGTTYRGGANGGGTIFELASPSGTLTTLYNFCAQANCADGSNPYAALMQAADGNFYGTTSAGGANSYGEVFKFINGANSLYVLHNFANSDGDAPYAGLLQGVDGNLYGTTNSGGANGDGTIFGLFQANVTTWHNDLLRTGQNTNEIVLTSTNLSTGNFGELCAASLDGQVYAQPLILSDVTFNGVQYSSLVYVLTQNNTLYVINGTPPTQGNPCAIVTSLSLNPPNQYPADCNYVGNENCSTVAPVVGALGTPVIQMTAGDIGTLYVVTETQDVPLGGVPQNWYHYLHAVSLGPNQVAESTAPIRIYPPILLCRSCSPAASYWSHRHIQRPGLLLVGNNLYIAFSMMDGLLPLPNGAVFRYNTANLNATPAFFGTTTNNNAGGGIWQGGAGLAYGPDETGKNYLYFNTGNGFWDGVTNFGDSFVKLDPTVMTVAGYFTPSDQYYRNCSQPYSDMDFGSGGVMLTPPNSYWPHLAVTGDKEGGIWAIDRLSPGGFNQGQCQNVCSPSYTCPPADQDNQNLQTIWLPPYNNVAPLIHNTPAYWNNNVYVSPAVTAPATSPVSQYQICNNNGSGQPFCGSPVYATNSAGTINTRYGATPAVSASPDSSDGIVWFTSGDGNPRSKNPGGLIAVDANTMTQAYANIGPGSACAQGDAIGPVIKFSVPTVANGFVYLGTQTVQNGVNNGTGTFYIFGPNRQCSGNIKRGTKSQSSMRSGVVKNTSDLR